MTGVLTERELSRRTFLKGGGALVVGFGLAAATRPGGAAAAADPYASPRLDQQQIDTWIAIHSDNTASIKSGSVFQGTGSTTGILMIAAEELDMDIGQVVHVQADTAVTPETGNKSASNTIVGGAGRGVRAVAAEARRVLVGLASERLGVPVAQLSVSKGVVSGGGKSVTYGDLLGDRLFNVTLPARYDLNRAGSRGFSGGLEAGESPAKPIAQYRLVGTRPPRVDIPSIVSGATTYVQNVRLPGMLHGRIVRPRGQAVYGFGSPVISVDEGSIRHIRGARVVRRKDFVGVVAEREYDAIQAAAQLKVKWAEPPKALPSSGNEFKRMRELDAAGKVVWSRTDLDRAAPNNGDVGRGLASATHTVSQSFSWPANVHNPMGAGCMIADVTPRGARIFAGSQGAYRIQSVVSAALGLPAEKVRVTVMPVGGAFGTSQYVDASIAAAVMSQAVGKPVRVQYMRWDEISWGNSGPGTLMDVRAGIDSKGKLVAFDFTQFYPQYKGGEESSNELAGTSPKVSSAISGNYYPAPMYEIPNSSYLLKSIPLVGNWFKAAWLRAGSGPLTTFAGEQVIDELAHAAGVDPVEFRRQNVTSGEARSSMLAVLDAVTKAAKWQAKVAASGPTSGDVVRGRGFAWSFTQHTRGAAAVADVEVNRRTGKVTVKHVYEAFNPGLAINPALVENQIVGGVTQIVSRLMVEQLRFDRSRVTSTDFVSYPILRFKDAPKVTPIVVQQPELKPRGAGEPVTVPVPAAIANAFFDATGVRMRTAPFTPARVRAVLKAAGA